MNSKYNSLPQRASDAGEQNLTRSSLPGRRSCSFLALRSLLLISIGANLLFLTHHFTQPRHMANDFLSNYAHLRRNIPTEIVSETDYNSLNRTLQDAAWNNVDVVPWNGIIALDDHYAYSQGLPHSQRWPWDPNMGVYVVTSSHELHCVRVLRVVVNENHDGVPESEQAWNYAHILHCLNLLRESIMCNADDTPLYIGRLHKNIPSKHPRAGTGTVKMCRDWNALLKWSRAHSACYWPVKYEDDSYSEIERYKYCPDGMRPWDAVEK